MFLGSRRQLPADSPLRGRSFGPYHFIDEERRAPARLRTTRLMRDCLRVMEERDLNHVCGFSGRPMLDERIGFDYLFDNVPDLMHALGRLFEFYSNVIRGGRGDSTRAKSWRDGNKDRLHREECQQLGIFPDVWPDRRVRLTDDVRATLLMPSDDEISTMQRGLCATWLKMVGQRTTGVRVNELRKRIMQMRVQLRQPGDFMFSPLKPSPLPWQLTKDGFDVVDRRVRGLVFPLNTERVLNKGRSFLQSTGATGKTSKKILMLMRILPTVLRGFVRALRIGLCYVVLALRLLEGQVHSFNTCRDLGIEPGTRCLNPEVIPKSKKLLIKGISMTTGAVPPSTIVPCLHLSSHYPDLAKLFGVLIW